MRALVGLNLVAMLVFAQEPGVIVVHPLEFKKAPLDFNKKTADDMQVELKRLTKKSGQKLCATPKDGKSDCETNDASLRELATEAKSLYALYANVDLSLDNLVIAIARVVRDDGVLIRGPKTVRLPLGKDKFADVSRVALAKAIEDLELRTLPKVRTASAIKETPEIVKPKESEVMLKPPEVVSMPPEVVKPIETKSHSGWMKPSGLIIGGVGAVTAIIGAVVFVTAPAAPETVNKIPFESSDAAVARQSTHGAGVALIGAGVGVAAVGAILFLAAPESASKPMVSVAPTANGATFSVQGRF
jgi:hypothetical protein